VVRPLVCSADEKIVEVHGFEDEHIDGECGSPSDCAKPKWKVGTVKPELDVEEDESNQ